MKLSSYDPGKVFRLETNEEKVIWSIDPVWVTHNEGRMGNYQITTLLNHLHFLFLNFILELIASVDYITSIEENNLWFISQNN